MSLIVQCPHCGTQFRLAPDLLKLKEGRVRCGVCRLVFDGARQRLPDIPVDTPVIAALNPIESSPVLMPFEVHAQEKAGLFSDIYPSNLKIPAFERSSVRIAALQSLDGVNDPSTFCALHCIPESSPANPVPSGTKGIDDKLFLPQENLSDNPSIDVGLGVASESISLAEELSSLELSSLELSSLELPPLLNIPSVPEDTASSAPKVRRPEGIDWKPITPSLMGANGESEYRAMPYLGGAVGTEVSSESQQEASLDTHPLAQHAQPGPDLPAVFRSSEAKSRPSLANDLSPNSGIQPPHDKAAALDTNAAIEIPAAVQAFVKPGQRALLASEQSDHAEPTDKSAWPNQSEPINKFQVSADAEQEHQAAVPLESSASDLTSSMVHFPRREKTVPPHPQRLTPSDAKTQPNQSEVRAEFLADPFAPSWKSQIFWGFALVLSIVVLLAQILLLTRTTLASALPASRPFLESACRLLNCVVGWPKDLGALSIESDPDGIVEALQDPKQQRFLLTLLLRNHSASPQSWPAIEITFTQSERPILRRILLPEQYLLPAHQGKPFAAGTEELLQIPFVAPALYAALNDQPPKVLSGVSGIEPTALVPNIPALGMTPSSAQPMTYHLSLFFP